ncbi:hypothetical protein PI124_g19718 [Phytophthora idaei]|nr:hypothetical protein PI124_g19718 [Phytophthora idaei]
MNLTRWTFVRYIAVLSGGTDPSSFPADMIALDSCAY